MTSDNVILVAFDVTAPDRETAHAMVKDGLSRVPLGQRGASRAEQYIESWWVAEDDRTDGSDNGSAVFVGVGEQNRAAAVLHRLGLTGRHNLVERPGSDERWWDELDWHAPNAESIPSGEVLADAVSLVLEAAAERATTEAQDDVRAAIDLLAQDVTAALQLDEDFCEECGDPSPNEYAVGSGKTVFLCESCHHDARRSGAFD